MLKNLLFRSLLHAGALLTTFLAFSSDSSRINVAKGEKVKLEKDVADIGGYYVCRGTDGGGKPYSGITVIMKKNEIYVVQWAVGTSSFAGIGIRQGNTFSVAWALPAEKGLVRGINQYRVEPGPRLVGRWAIMPGNGVMQSETLTFLKALEEEE